MIRQFIAEFRDRWSVRRRSAPASRSAPPCSAWPSRHFAREATLTGRAGLGLAGGALLITLAALGYVFQLSADEPGLTPVDLWSLAARLAVRNLPAAGVLSAAPAAGLALLAARDPAVLLLGLPLFLLHALKLLARPGCAAPSPPRPRARPPIRPRATSGLAARRSAG